MQARIEAVPVELISIAVRFLKLMEDDRPVLAFGVKSSTPDEGSRLRYNPGT